MLNLQAGEQIRTLSDFLDSSGFHAANNALGAESGARLLPDFRSLQEELRAWSPFHRFFFSIFRQGHATDERALRAYLPPDVIGAALDTGLLIRNQWGEYQTPGLAMVSVQGLKLAVSLPPNYPTAGDRKQPIYIGIDSLMCASSLPVSLSGKRVLDICAGSGVQGLICAARGAERVVSLELSPVAANAARFNAALNGLDEVVEVRESNLYTALASGERFDFVTSNPPFMPMLEDVDFPRPGAGGADGLTTLRPLLTQLTDHVEAEFSGVMVCQVLGDNRSIFINRELNELAAREGYQVDAVVSQKQSLTRYQATWMEPSLRLTCPELPEERRAVLLQEWAGAMKAQGASQVYFQLLCFERPAPRPGLRHVPLYHAPQTDPLTALVTRHRAVA